MPFSSQLQPQLQLQVIIHHKQLKNINQCINQRHGNIYKKKALSKQKQESKSYINKKRMVKQLSKNNIPYLIQNSLNKDKNLSIKLDVSSKLSSNVAFKQKLQRQKCIRQNLKLGQKQQSQSKDKIINKSNTQKIYSYYASKNQKKFKILSKAKQLGKDNFNKFLKGSSIIQINKHIGRFNIPMIRQQMGNPHEDQCPSPQIDPLIVSFQLIRQGTTEPLNKKQLHLPKLLGKGNFIFKKRFKIQNHIEDNNFLLAKQQNVIQQLQLLKSLRKHITRSLTQINQKVRQNRQAFKDHSLLKLNYDKKGSLNFLEKWTYKSLFESQLQPTRKNDDQRKNNLVQLESLQSAEKISHLPKNQQKSQKGKLKYFKIERCNLLRQQLKKVVNKAYLRKNEQPVDKVGIKQLKDQN